LVKAYFFPGLGADESLANHHAVAGIEQIWIRWPKTIASNWSDFLTAMQNENIIEPNSIWIGISFGGVVAQKLATLKKPKAILLIGSAKNPAAIAPMFRPFQKLVGACPAFLFNLNWVPKIFCKWFFWIDAPEGA